MLEKKLTQSQSWNAAYIFLRSLWDQDPAKFASLGIGLGAYLNFANSDFKYDFDWRRACKSFFHSAWNDNESLSSVDIFKITTILVKKSKQKYGFNLLPVENLITEMEQNPSHSQWKLWECSLKEAGQGKERIWLTDYQFSDWRNKF